MFLRWQLEVFFIRAPDEENIALVHFYYFREVGNVRIEFLLRPGPVSLRFDCQALNSCFAFMVFYPIQLVGTLMQMMVHLHKLKVRIF
jgi:hypothetical protein